MAAIEQGGVVALANKEALVSAGEVMTAAVASTGDAAAGRFRAQRDLPVPRRQRPADVRRITLTASGGPLRGWSHEQLRAATPAQAVAHPNWSMGAKISVDSRR
jgi:1-deoxy-D-xylulose-5-phosphate reductoisomerase